MTRLKLPEDRTPEEVARTIKYNQMIRKICMLEIRRTASFAHADGRSKTTPDDRYRAMRSTSDARRIIDRLYGEPNYY